VASREELEERLIIRSQAAPELCPSFRQRGVAFAGNPRGCIACSSDFSRAVAPRADHAETSEFLPGFFTHKQADSQDLFIEECMLQAHTTTRHKRQWIAQGLLIRSAVRKASELRSGKGTTAIPIL